jgi:hypothetical protein
MSKLETNTIDTVSGSNTLTLGSTNTSTISVGSPISNGLTLSDNILFDTADKGIYLGTTTATASNLLDDYEEGTWTPAIQGSSTAGTYTYLEQQGHYVKVGNQVTTWFNLSNITTGSAGSGSLYLTGLPFTINWQSGFNGAGIGSAELNYFTGISGDTIVVLGSDNTDFLLFYHSTGTSNLSSIINVTDKNNDAADVRGFVTYYTGG